jgi:IS5 family transposase
MAGLLYLKHAFALSDEALIARWVENAYWRVPRTSVDSPVELC